MTVAAIIQARMGSTRLPGKMMLPLGGVETITRVIRRTAAAKSVDEVVVATTSKKRDFLIAKRAREEGVTVYRGDEQDVLTRTLEAADSVGADTIVRIAGDCPAVSPQIIDHAVQTNHDSNSDYVSNKLNRTFPLGLDVEVFTRDSFVDVDKAATEPEEREHVTVYYLEHQQSFDTRNFTSDEIFDEKPYQNRTDIALVLDEAADYLYLDRIFSDIPDDQPDIRSIIDFVDRHDLGEMLSDVSRTIDDEDS